MWPLNCYLFQVLLSFILIVIIAIWIHVYEVIQFYITCIAFLKIEGYFSGIEALNNDLEKFYFKRCFA